MSSTAATGSDEQLNVSLSAPDICHLSYLPTFVVKVSVTSQQSCPITVLRAYSIFDPYAFWRGALELVNTTTGAVVILGNAIDCQPEIGRSWQDEKEFVTLEPGVPHVTEITFGSSAAGTKSLALKNRESYTIRPSQAASELKWWWWGKKEAVLHKDEHPEGKNNEDDEQYCGDLGTPENPPIQLTDCRASFRVAE